LDNPPTKEFNSKEGPK
jgi:serine/threonine protein kinase